MNVALPAEHGPVDLLSICTGGAGLDLAVELALPGARAVCMVEREAYACGRLVEAMEEGRMASAPIWTDAVTFRGRRWRGLVDGLIGGIPCQPHSLAGKRGGADDERDLWSDARRIIVQARPWFVLIENVPGMLTAKPGQVPGAERVRRDLHRLGFAVEGGLFSAEELGFSHERERVFILGTWSGPCLADAQRHGWREGTDVLQPRAEQSEAALQGEDLADRPSVDGGLYARQRRPGEGAVVPGWDGEGADLVHALGRDFDGRPIEPERRPPGRGVAGGPGALPLHAPGPDDLDGWRAVLAERPELAPALPQSDLRRLADGLDRPRIDELRLGGNGVVPLVGGYALRTLATRLAARGSAGAALLVRMMEQPHD